MSRWFPTCLAVVLLFDISAEAQVPSGLFKTYRASHSGGRTSFAITITGAKGNRLVGSFTNNFGQAGKMDPDDETAYMSGTISGNSVVLKTTNAEFNFQYANGSLRGSIKFKTPPSRCPAEEQITAS